jgi:maleate isomerase
MHEQLGQRRRIGVIYPASGRNDDEMREFLPPELSLHFTRVRIPLPDTGVFHDATVSYPDLRRAGQEIAEVEPDCVLWPCTAENIRRGAAGEHEQKAAIAASCPRPVVTAASSVKAALAHLGTTRIGIGAPYRDEVVAGLAAYFAERGIGPLTRIALGLTGDRAICALTAQDTYELAKAADHGAAEAVFISCGSMRIRSVINEVERELGKPVVTTTMAVMWNALRTVGLTAALSGMGRLFASTR